MGQQLIDAEEYIRRIRLCLFEVGFRDVLIEHKGWTEAGLPWVATYNQDVPVQLAYMAARLAVIQDLPDVPQCCYGCFRLGFTLPPGGTVNPPAECRSGNCVTGGPAWPSHEELLGADRTEGLEIHEHVA
jgi:hypothetical protein